MNLICLTTEGAQISLFHDYNKIPEPGLLGVAHRSRGSRAGYQHQLRLSEGALWMKKTTPQNRNPERATQGSGCLLGLSVSRPVRAAFFLPRDSTQRPKDLPPAPPLKGPGALPALPL